MPCSGPGPINLISIHTLETNCASYLCSDRKYSVCLSAVCLSVSVCRVSVRPARPALPCARLLAADLLRLALGRGRPVCALVAPVETEERRRLPYL